MISLVAASAIADGNAKEPQLLVTLGLHRGLRSRIDTSGAAKRVLGCLLTKDRRSLMSRLSLIRRVAFPMLAAAACQGALAQSALRSGVFGSTSRLCARTWATRQPRGCSRDFRKSLLTPWRAARRRRHIDRADRLRHSGANQRIAPLGTISAGLRRSGASSGRCGRLQNMRRRRSTRHWSNSPNRQRVIELVQALTFWLARDL
jgi:hypothetical protein